MKMRFMIAFFVLNGLSAQSQCRAAELTNEDVLQERIDDVSKHKGDQITTITLPPGVIRLSKPLQLSHTKNLSIQGAGKHETYIFGSRSYPTRKVRSNEAVPSGIDRNDVLVIDADEQLRILWREGAEDGLGCSSTSLISIFQADKRLQCARWPNTSYAYARVADSDVSYAVAFDIPPEKKSIWSDSDSLSVGGYFARDWFYELANARFDLDEQRITISSLKQEFRPQSTIRYFVQGAPGDLDEDGEFISDPASNRIFLKPFMSDNQTPNVEIAVDSNLIEIQDSENVEIKGLSLAFALGSGLELRKVKNVVLSDLTVENIRKTGVLIDKSRSVRVIRVNISNIGGTGISLSGGDRDTLTPGNNELTESTVTNTSELMKTYHAAVSLSGVGNIVTSNQISNTPHIAISFYGNNHIISGNELSNVVRETSDSGAIYAGADWTWRGTKIERNFFHDIHSSAHITGIGSTTTRFEVKGVYFDDLLSGNEVNYNIFCKVEQPVFLGGGRDNKVVGNVFAEVPGAAITLDDRGLTWKRGAIWDPDSSFSKGLRAVPFNRGAYAAQYPSLSTVMIDNPGAPVGNIYESNLVGNEHEFQFRGTSREYTKLENNMYASHPFIDTCDIESLKKWYREQKFKMPIISEVIRNIEESQRRRVHQ